MSVTKRDYYDILGVGRDCDDQGLKGAYRKLALQYHPDRNPGNHAAEEKVQEAAEAYSILSDSQKRAAYDRFGHQGVASMAGNGFDGAAGFPDLADILSDVFGFGDVFGGGGRGQIIRRPCKECKGEGYLRRERKLKVNIPAGVDEGTQLRLSSEGQPGINGGPPGDLYVVLKVAEHPVFDRRQSDLYCLVPINVAQAVLGASVDILTFDGLQTVKIPEGAQPGMRLRLKGLVVPHLNSSGRGDLYVQ